MQNSALIDGLRQFGFTEKEARVYLCLLEINEASPGFIARRAEVNRSTCYTILESLVRRGLVSEVPEKQLSYRAVDPELFLKEEQHKLELVEGSFFELKDMLPELYTMHQDFAATPQMEVFKGKDGLIQIMEDTLTTSTELLCWANVSMSWQTLADYYPTYIQKKVERKIWLRGIFCFDDYGQLFKARGEEELREAYLVPKEEFPFQNEINIYDDKVAIISHPDEIGVIIHNKNIAETQRAIFRLGFIAAKTLEAERFGNLPSLRYAGGI